MKNILYTIILSFLFSSAYAGSVDGKGVVCETSDTRGKAIRKIHIWFDDDYAIKYMISGYKVDEMKQPYREEGTNYITWGNYRLYRRTLDLKFDPSFSENAYYYSCKIIIQKQEILDYYNKIIEQAKKNNQL